MAQERLQKILAQAGIASRRSAEGLITSGHVRVNGKVVTELGVTADIRKDRIEIDGKKIVPERPVYFLFHKPRGMVSTLRDPEGRPHLGEVVKQMGTRVYPIGRLDFHTSGVLLITNDGELTEALLHPRKHVPKTYVAKVRGMMTIDELDKLRNGVVLDDGHKTAKADVFVIREEERNTWLQITLYEGKNRQIHRMGEAIGHPILRLARTAFANITGDGLKPGEWRSLSQDELDKLKKNWLTPFRRARDKEQQSELGGMQVDEPDDERPLRASASALGAGPRGVGARRGAGARGAGARGASSQAPVSRGSSSRGTGSRSPDSPSASSRGAVSRGDAPRSFTDEASAGGKRGRGARTDGTRDVAESGGRRAGRTAGAGRDAGPGREVAGQRPEAGPRRDADAGRAEGPARGAKRRATSIDDELSGQSRGAWPSVASARGVGLPREAGSRSARGRGPARTDDDGSARSGAKPRGPRAPKAGGRGPRRG